MAARQHLFTRLRDDVARLHQRLLANEAECQTLLVKEEEGTLTTSDLERLKTARRTQRWLHMELAALRAEFVQLRDGGRT